MKHLCVLLMILVLAAQADAQCRTYASSYSYAPSYTPSYSYTPVATVVIPVAQYVAVPFYSAVYVPPATVTTTTVTAAQQTAVAAQQTTVAASTTNACAETAMVMKEMLMVMKDMRSEQAAALKSLMPMPQQQPKKDLLPLPKEKAAADDQALADAAVAILKKPLGMSGTSCASCHSVGQPTEKSADFFLFDQGGTLRNIGESLAQSMTRKITKERKCPGAPAALTGEDKAVVLKALPPLDAKP